MERIENEDSKLNSNTGGLSISISENVITNKTTVPTDTDKVSVLPKSEDQVPTEDKNVDTDELEALKIASWIKKSEHKVRLAISICILCLFMGWVIAGIILFAWTGNFSPLLYGSPILIPFQWVLNYYFPRHNRR